MAKKTEAEMSNLKSLRVLMVEDSEDDALLALRALIKGGFEPEYERVETAAAMRKALQNKIWDIILCDYQMPAFNGTEAIALLKKMVIDIPIIIVSGVIGEDTAVECMRLGAQDYIMKNQLARLVSSVARELEERKTREKIKQTEAKIQENEQRLKALFENMSSCVAIYEAVAGGSDFVFREFNRAAEKTEHVKRSDIIGKSLLEVFPGVREMGLFAVLQRVWQSGVPEHLAESYYQDNRVQGWKENYVYKLASGEVVAMYDDVTGRVKSQQEISKSNRLYSFISQINQLIVRIRERDKLFAEVCRIAVEYGKFHMAWIGLVDDQEQAVVPFAWSGAEDGYLSIIKKISVKDIPEGRGTTGTAIRERHYICCNDIEQDPRMVIWRDEALKRGYRSSIALPISMQDKVIGALNIYSSEVSFFTESEIDLLCEVTVSITYALEMMVNEDKRVKTQEALRQSEEKYRIVAETAHDFILVADLNYRITYANKAASGFISGIDPVGMSIIDVTPLNLSPMQEEMMAKRRAGNDEVFSFEWEIRNEDGNAIYIDVRSQLLKEEGIPAGILFIARDITESKLIQTEIVRKSEEIADLYNNAPCGYHSLGPDGTVLRMNDTELKWLGYDQKEVIGKRKWTDFLTANGRLIFQRTFPVLKNQKWIRDIEYELVRKDGSTFPVLLNATTVNDEKGNYIESRSTCFDIAERKQAEEERHRLKAELFQSQKMEAIGTLAGGIAHDLNNILGGILGYTELVLTTHITQDHPARKYMDGVLRGVDRACDLVSHIKTFSRQEEKERKLMGIGPIIKEALKLIKATLSAKIELRQRITDVEKTIFADPTQMHQVVMNLCTNAAHAMKEKGGVLDISLSQVTFNADDIVPHPDLKTGIEYELLIVRDTGVGIDPENIERIFDPFFTTKKPGEGTGLGLAVAYGIIKNHDGVIFVESNPGLGSTFRVYIPTIIAAREEKNKQLDDVMPGGSERIMFVDDETALTTIFKIQFESLGYSVDVYNDPVEALAAFQKESQSFALITTDMAMPHMMGIDLARELTQIRPDLPVILCTGAVEELDQELLQSLGVRRLILKPIFTKDLARAIRNVLDGKDQD